MCLRCFKTDQKLHGAVKSLTASTEPRWKDAHHQGKNITKNPKMANFSNSAWHAHLSVLVCGCEPLQAAHFTHTQTDPCSASLWQLVTEENNEWCRQGRCEWRRMTNLTVYERLPVNHHELINKTKDDRSEGNIMNHPSQSIIVYNVSFHTWLNTF